MLDTQQTKKILYNILVATLVVVAGMIAVNQWLEFRYKAVLLQQPCVVCADLNQAQEGCIRSCFNPEPINNQKEFYNNFNKSNLLNFTL